MLYPCTPGVSLGGWFTWKKNWFDLCTAGMEWILSANLQLLQDWSPWSWRDGTTAWSCPFYPGPVSSILISVCFPGIFISVPRKTNGIWIRPASSELSYTGRRTYLRSARLTTSTNALHAARRSVFQEAKDVLRSGVRSAAPHLLRIAKRADEVSDVWIYCYQ